MQIMTVGEGWHYAFLYVGLINGLLLCAALLLRRDNSVANKILATYLAINLALHVCFTLRETERIIEFPWLIALHFPLYLFSVPLLYFYVLSMTEADFKFEKHHALHFIPALLAGLFYLTVQTRGLPPAEMFVYSQHTLPLRQVMSLVVFIAYISLAWLRVSAFAKTVDDYFSDVKLLRLNWLRNLLAILLPSCFLTLMDVLFGKVMIFHQINGVVLVSTVLAMAFFSLRQSVLFGNPELRKARDEVLEFNDTLERMETSQVRPPLSTTQIQRETLRILDYMESSRIYLNPKLRLGHLADALGLKNYEVSLLLNQGLKMSFRDFITDQRIEEAKRRLSDPHYKAGSVATLAFECGFTSTSSFISLFKKSTGSTPSEYRAGSARIERQGRASNVARFSK